MCVCKICCFGDEKKCVCTWQNGAIGKIVRRLLGQSFFEANLKLGYDSYLPLSLTFQNVVDVSKLGCMIYKITKYHTTFFAH